MFQVKFCLPSENWEVHRFKVGGNDIADAWVRTYTAMKQVMPELPIEFISLGNYSFLIWGANKCQGYIAIEDTSVDIISFDTEVRA